jgi:uncharacterized membrane protein YcfT
MMILVCLIFGKVVRLLSRSPFARWVNSPSALLPRDMDKTITYKEKIT